MKYKTLVRLLVKLMGIYLLIFGTGSLIASIVYLLMALTEYGSFGGLTIIAYPLSWGISSVFTIIAGLILLLASNWVVSKLIPSNRPYCPNCGYELTGAIRQACPECGLDVSGLGLTPEQ